jgi:general secretion pathway protein K
MTPPYHAQRGMILVVVLWVIAMMTTIVVSLSAFTQKNISLAGVETDRLRSEQLLFSSLEVAKAVILATPEENRVFLNGSPKRLDLGNGNIVEVMVQDTSGLIDLNRTPVPLLEALAAQLSSGSSETAALIAEIIRRRSAKLLVTSRQGSPAQPKIQPVPFAAEGELRALPGGSRATLGNLGKLATLFTADGKVNPLSAPDPVLMAIPGLTPQDKAIFESARAQNRWKQPQVQNALETYAEYLAVRESRIFNIEVTIVANNHGPTGQKLTSTVILDQAADVPFQTLALSW